MPNGIVLLETDAARAHLSHFAQPCWSELLHPRMTGLRIHQKWPKHGVSFLDDVRGDDMFLECLERRALARTCCSAQSVLDDSLIQDVFLLISPQLSGCFVEALAGGAAQAKRLGQIARCQLADWCCAASISAIA
jgi:hypothetical protein